MIRLAYAHKPYTQLGISEDWMAKSGICFQWLGSGCLIHSPKYLNILFSSEAKIRKCVWGKHQATNTQKSQQKSPVPGCASNVKSCLAYVTARYWTETCCAHMLLTKRWPHQWFYENASSPAIPWKSSRKSALAHIYQEVRMKPRAKSSNLQHLGISRPVL